MTRQLTNVKQREDEHFTILEDLGAGSLTASAITSDHVATIQLCLANYSMESSLQEQLKVVDSSAATCSSPLRSSSNSPVSRDELSAA